MVVLSSNISSEEDKVLEEFLKLVADLGQDEATCSRFLRARNYDKKKAEEMLRKSVQWRVKNNLKDCLNWEIPQPILNVFTCKYDLKDEFGRAVIYIPLGKWDVPKFVQDGWKEDMYRNIYVVLENIEKARRDSGHEQFLCIVDLDGFEFYKWMNYDSFQMVVQVFKLFEGNYPETLYKAVAINAPRAFSFAFPYIKPLMSGHTLSKVNIYDSNVVKWREDLLQELSQETLRALPIKSV